MREIIIALLLAMALGTASGLPLQGSNDNVTAVIFGSSRMPVGDENSTLEILKVDVGLMGADNASYELVDQNGLVYSPGLYRPLSSGKQVIYFLTQMDSLFKLINVTPNGSDIIHVNWWMTPNASNGKMKIRYYGITDSSINSDEQTVVLQLSAQNIGTERIFVTPYNFTLFDQWGWPYQPTAGFEPESIEPGSATSGRLLLEYAGLSPAVRPAALAYDYGSSGQMAIEFERDYVPLPNEKVYGSALPADKAALNASSSAAVAPLPVEAAAQAINGTDAAAAVQPAAPTAENAAGKTGTIKEQLAASKARLNAARLGLDQKTSQSNDTALKPPL